MNVAVVVFPGTNCDIDTLRACKYLGWDVEQVFYTETNLDKFNLIILPGGFSFGDYISAGRLAKFSPVVKALASYIEARKGFVLGICNGFQILCEMGVLPGALTANESGRFLCKNSALIFNNADFSLPIAHKYGRYFADDEDLQTIKNKNMDFLKYQNDENGSLNLIAGLYDREKQVIGMMPHPERAVFTELGAKGGVEFFRYVESEILCKK